MDGMNVISLIAQPPDTVSSLVRHGELVCDAGVLTLCRRHCHRGQKQDVVIVNFCHAEVEVQFGAIEFRRLLDKTTVVDTSLESLVGIKDYAVYCDVVTFTARNLFK